MSADERSLRRLALCSPLDPAPITALGFHALARRAVDDAALHFADALRLDPLRMNALVGSELVHYIRRGDAGPLRDLIGGSNDALDGIPEPAAGFLAHLSAKARSAAPEHGAAGTSAAARRLRARDLGSALRTQAVAGQPSPPPVGRTRELRELELAATNSPHLSIVLVGGYGVDLELACDALLPAFAEMQSERTGATLSEIVGPFPVADLAGSFDEFLDDLRNEREQGHLFFHRNLGELLGGLPVSAAAALFETGAFLTAAPKHVLDGMLARVPGLALRLALVRVEPLGRPEALAALTASAEALAAWAGRPIPQTLLRDLLRVADHYLPHVALPESAIMILGDGVGQRASGRGRTPVQAPPLDAERLHATAVRAARIAPDALLARRAFSAADIADGLFDRVGSHRDACAFLGRTLASACVAGGIKSKRDAPDAVLLLIGPAGVGKQTAARELAGLLYGRDAFLSVDLALYGGTPVGLFDMGRQDAGPGMVDSFVSGRPFSVLYFANVHLAAPATLSHLRDVIETGRLGPGGTGPSLRRSVVVLSIDGWREGGDLGFTSGPPPAADLAWVRDVYFGAAPGILHSITLVPLRPLQDREYADVVRRRLDRIVVQRLAAERDIDVSITENAIAHLASEVKASKLGGERIEEVIEESVLAPLWELLAGGAHRPVLKFEHGRLVWHTSKRPRRSGSVLPGTPRASSTARRRSHAPTVPKRKGRS